MKNQGSPWFHTAARIIGVLIVLGLISSLIDTYMKQGIVREYEEAYEKTKSENDELKKRLAEAETTEFIEREARNKLGFIREGETLVLIDTPEPTSPDYRRSGTEGEAVLADQNLPNWKRWWRLLF